MVILTEGATWLYLTISERGDIKPSAPDADLWESDEAKD